MGRKRAPLPPAETQFVPAGSDEDEQMYAAVKILDERVSRNGRGEYLVQWEGIDPTTDENWKPTWEPKSAVTNDLIKSWKEEKKKDPTLMGRVKREEEALKREAAEKKKKKAEEMKRKRASSGLGKRDTTDSESTDGRLGSKRKRISVVGETTRQSKRSRGTSDPISVASSSTPVTRQSSKDVSSPVKAIAARVSTGSRLATIDPDPSDDMPIPDAPDPVEPDGPVEADKGAAKPTKRNSPVPVVDVPQTSTKPGPAKIRQGGAQTASAAGQVAEVNGQKEKANGDEQDAEASKQKGTSKVVGASVKTTSKMTSPSIILPSALKKSNIASVKTATAAKEVSTTTADAAKDANAKSAPSTPGNKHVTVISPSGEAGQSKATGSPAPAGPSKVAPPKTLVNPPKVTGTNASTPLGPLKAAQLTLDQPNTTSALSTSKSFDTIAVTSSKIVPVVPKAKPLPTTKTTRISAVQPSLPATAVAGQSSKQATAQPAKQALATQAIDRPGEQAAVAKPVKQATVQTKPSSVPSTTKASKSTPAVVPPTIALSTHPARTSTPPFTMSKAMGPIPKPSPSTFRNSLPSESTSSQATNSQADKSVPISQADPIVEFSSPAGRKSIGGEQMDVDGSEGNAADEAESVPVKLVQKVIDGEVWMMDTQSQGGSLPSAPRDDVGQQNGKTAAREGSDEVDSYGDADLDDFDLPDEATLSIVGQKTTPASVESTKSATSEVAPSILAEKDKEIAKLQKDVAELEASLRGSRAEKSASEERHGQNDKEIETLLSRVTELEDSITDLTAKWRSAEASKTSADKEYNFMRAQYDLASRGALENSQKANELESQVETLRGQLDLGLKQKNLHFETIQRKRQEENTKLRLQNKILLDQARLTDDTVRAKAAAFDGFQAHNTALVNDNQLWESKYDSLQARNEELVEQLAVLRGRQMGVFDDDSDVDSNYSEGDAEDDMTDQDEFQSRRPTRLRASSPTKLARNEQEMVYTTKPDSASSDPHDTMDIIPGDSQLGLGALEKLNIDLTESAMSVGQGSSARRGMEVEVDEDEMEVELSVEGGKGYICMWYDGSEQCPFMFDTQVALGEHAREHADVGDQDHHRRGYAEEYCRAHR